MSDITKGDRFTLTHPGGFGTGIGLIPEGTEVEVQQALDQPTPGVGGNEGVVFGWTSNAGRVSRLAHLPSEDFARMFTKVGK